MRADADLVLGGRYVVRKLIGAGGSATVHRADDERLGRQVAVKLLHPHLLADPGIVAAFLHEARTAAGLNHPGIVAVHDVGEDVVADGVIPWMVLELVDGRTVRQLLATDGPFRPEPALTIVASVLEALDRSHRHGVIHRDVSPGNVMVAADGQVKVTDFGIAAAVGTDLDDPTIRGTAAYLSPEQAGGAAVDARSDLYSAGCLLFAMLTGRPPFTADTAADLVWEHVREDPPAPSAVNPELSPRLDAVVLRALAKEPSRRYPDAMSMRRALVAARDRLTGTQAVPAVPVPIPERPTSVPRERRSPTPAAETDLSPRGGLVALVVIAVAVLLGAGIWWSVPKGEPPAATQAESVAVPAVAGLDLDDAVARLQAAGLRERTRSIEVSDTVPAGKVIRTVPAAGTQVSKQRAIDVVVSGGPSRTQVPNLAGGSVDQWRKALSTAGLRLGGVTERDSPQRAGIVLDAQPAAGTVVRPGTVVGLVVASGWSAVPDVRGRPLEEARGLVWAAGFAVETRTTQGPGAPGSVLSTDPWAGSRTRIGTTVLLYQVGASAAPAASATPSPTPSRASSPQPSPVPSSTPTPSVEPTATPSPTPSRTPSPTPAP